MMNESDVITLTALIDEHGLPDVLIQMSHIVGQAASESPDKSGKRWLGCRKARILMQAADSLKT